MTTMTDHPWEVFLHHRARVLRWFREEGKTPAEVAHVLSMDPGQVRLILAYVDDYPEDFVDAVAPVPLPMARRVAARKEGAASPGGEKR